MDEAKRDCDSENDLFADIDEQWRLDMHDINT